MIKIPVIISPCFRISTQFIEDQIGLLQLVSVFDCLQNFVIIFNNGRNDQACQSISDINDTIYGQL